MKTDLRLHFLALCTLVALTACQMSTPAARQPPAPVAKQPPSMERVPTHAAAAAGQANLALSDGRGQQATWLNVTMTLHTGGAKVAGTQNDIEYDPKQVAVGQTPAGKPDCQANKELGKEGTAFSFMPQGCRGAACTSVRALVLSLSNVDPIPDGSELYTCRIQIPNNAHPGSARLSLARVGFSSPDGKSIPGTGTDSTITIDSLR